MLEYYLSLRSYLRPSIGLKQFCCGPQLLLGLSESRCVCWEISRCRTSTRVNYHCMLWDCAAWASEWVVDILSIFCKICVKTPICPILTYYLLYCVIPWSKVILEKLMAVQLVKNFPASHGTLITVFKRAATEAFHEWLCTQEDLLDQSKWKHIFIGK
jgi:hypothetical protein